MIGIYAGLAFSAALALWFGRVDRRRRWGDCRTRSAPVRRGRPLHRARSSTVATRTDARVEPCTASSHRSGGLP